MDEADKGNALDIGLKPGLSFRIVRGAIEDFEMLQRQVS
jgi:hypothetical protein